MTRFEELTAEERLLMRSEVRLAALDPGAAERVRSAWEAEFYLPIIIMGTRGPSSHDAFATAVRTALRPQPKVEGG